MSVVADQAYPEIGMYCFGRGFFHKTPRLGFQVGEKDLFKICEGDLILQVTFAWEGAIGVAGQAEHGMFGSTRYPTFRVNEELCNAHFIANFLTTPNGLAQIGRICPGSAGRNRVLGLKRLNEIVVPLPPIGEQRRIVARIEALGAKIAEARGLREASETECRLAYQQALRRSFTPPIGRVVADYAKLQSGYAFQSGWFTPTGIRLVRNINIGHGRIDWSQTALIPAERKSEFYRFELREGDILISLDRPIISTGIKVAVVRTPDVPSLLLQRVARVQFQNGNVDPAYFFAWLHSPHFVEAIDPGRSNGVPHISPKDVERLPFEAPPLDRQRKVVEYLAMLRARIEMVKETQSATAAELTALLPSVLDKAFKGEL